LFDMNAAAAVPFPPGRLVASWQRDLARLDPQALWVVHLLVHRVEAPVAGHSLEPLDCLHEGLLRYLPAASAPEPGNCLADLAAPLHLDEQLLLRVLLSLQNLGLAQPSTTPGDPRPRWARTDLGSQALEAGGVRREGQARRVFHFIVANPDAETARFLPLEAPPLTPAEEPWSFRLAWLMEALEQPREWKERHGFPADATTLAAPGEAREPWESIVVAAHGWLSLLCVRSGAAGGETLQGFPVQPEGWTLKLHQPVLRLGPEWAELLPELAAAPTLDEWRQSWKQWTQPRSLPAAEVDACRLEEAGLTLRVTPPPALLERLRAARSDALKGDAWLLAGRDRVRRLLRVEIVERTAGS
jgi:hypothetical protein